MRPALVALALLATACPTRHNPLYCESHEECVNDPARPFCDLDGSHGGTRNLCIPTPPEPDAGPPSIDASGGGCTTSSECVNASAPICDDSTKTCRGCAASPECAARDGALPTCAPDGRCVECLAHDDCMSEICDSATESCVAESEVVYVEPSGSTGVACGTQFDPCATLTLGVQRTSAARKYIRARAGIYVAEPATVTIPGGKVVLVAPSAELRPPSTGDGISAAGGADVSIEGLTVSGPISATFSGISCSGAATKLTLQSVTIESASSDGLDARCPALLSDTVIRSSKGYGVFVGADITLVRTRIEGNAMGGINSPSNTAAMTMTECVVADNNGVGIVVAYKNTVAIDRSLIRGNTLGLSLYTVTDLDVTNNFIVDNRDGGVSLVAGSSGVFAFNTVAGNSVGAASAAGIECESGTDLQNNVVYGNVGSPQVSSSCTWSFSNVEGGVPGTANIDLLPQFVAPESGNYHLQPTSPCREMADPTAPVDVDYDGDPRPSGGRSDIGADEVPP
jgi:hypothetical protein